MALQKNVELPTGVVVSYWKIAQDGLMIQSSKRYSEQEIPFDPNNPIDIGMGMIPIVENPKIYIIIYGYLDEAARRAGKEPIMAVNAAIDCPTEGNFSDERRLLLYTMLKLQEYWTGAADVFEEGQQI